MLGRGSTKDIAVLTHDSIIAYRENLLKDINLKVRIAVDDKTYITKLSEWEDDQITLAAPLEQLDWVILPVSRPLEIAFMTKTALYTTQVQVLTPLKKNGSVYYSCKILKPLIRKQQRQFFRLDTMLEATYQLLPEDVISMPINSPHYKGTIVNISVGGVCLVIDECLKADTLIYMSFDFLETKLSLVGKVLFDGERTPSETYSHRLKFVNLSNGDENTLNRLIMTKQRLMRKTLNV